MIAASRRLAVLGIAAALLIGASGCSLIEDVMQRKTTSSENLEYQRMTARMFVSNRPYVEAITFTREGGIDGSGEWSTNAVVTIEGKDYNQIFGVSLVGGDPLPSPPSSFSPAPVTIIYSDGTSEVFQ